MMKINSIIIIENDMCVDFYLLNDVHDRSIAIIKNSCIVSPYPLLSN